MGKSWRADVMITSTCILNLTPPTYNVESEGHVIQRGNAVSEMYLYFASQCGCGMQRSRRPVVMLTTVVSSRMLLEMGRQEGFEVLQTLTGFKWLGNWSCRLELEGKCVPFAFEEAIGFSLGERLRDKDGIAGAAGTAPTHTKNYVQALTDSLT
jgi:phosphomannomutase